MTSGKGPREPADWSAIRREFPALADRVYLNTAGGGPMCRAAVEKAKSYYDEFAAAADTKWDEWLERVEATRGLLAELLGASADELAFLSNASTGLSQVAAMLAPRGRVLLVGDDFPSVTFPWLQRRADVHFLETEGDGSIPIESLERALDEERGTEVLAASLVQYRTGFRLPLPEWVELCRKHEVRFVVDATQAFAVTPIDLSRDAPDALVFSGYKWTTAGYSVAPLYLRRELLESHPLPAAGWRSAEDPYALDSRRLTATREARGLELGHPPFPGIFALEGALELIASIGIEAISQRVQELMDRMLEGLGELGVEVISPRERSQRAGIIMLRLTQPQSVQARLRERRIYVSARGEGLRVSLHYYNDREDIDRFLAALGEMKVASSR